MGRPFGAAVTERVKKAIHVVSAWAGELSLVLGKEKVDEKTNEIKAIPELLGYDAVA